MSQFEDLEVNPEKPDHHRIYLYPASGTLEQEIGPVEAKLQFEDI